VLVSGIGCGTGAARQGGAALGDTFESPERAASALLEALAAKDVGRLRTLALSEREFRAVIWPELPSSRPDVNLPVDYAWGTLHQNSTASLAMTLREHGGRQYRFRRVDLGQKVSRYATFDVHRDVAILVEDPTGGERRLDLFGSLLEHEGRWKIFSYVVD
jgi:hypothetical protein